MNTNWPICKLSDVADVRVSNVDKKTSNAETPVKLCNYMDVYTNDYVTESIDFMAASASKSEIDRFGLQSGDVLITKDSETPDDIGVPAMVADSIDGLVCGYHLALIRPRNGAINSIYLAKQLCSPPIVRYFSLNASGSTRFGLPVSVIEDAQIPIAPEFEQAEIAKILSTVDRAIEQTEKLIDKQRRIRIGLMNDLLTRGIDKRGNLRSEQTHQFKDSPLGRIPAEWEICTIDDIARHVGSGITPRGGESVYEVDGVLFIRSQNVHFDGLRLADAAYIPERIHLSMQRTEVREHDILLNITGASIGRCCTMPKIGAQANVNQHVCAIRLYDVVETKAGVLAAILGSSIGQTQIALLNAGGNREGLNYQQVRSFLVPWPKIPEEFDRLYKIMEMMSDDVCIWRSSSEKLHALKTGLMQDLLTARRRVTVLATDDERIELS